VKQADDLVQGHLRNRTFRNAVPGQSLDKLLADVAVEQRTIYLCLGVHISFRRIPPVWWCAPFPAWRRLRLRVVRLTTLLIQNDYNIRVKPGSVFDKRSRQSFYAAASSSVTFGRSWGFLLARLLSESAWAFGGSPDDLLNLLRRHFRPSNQT